MSDFLATIAARTIGTESGILPRQPVRFEPDASLGELQEIVGHEDQETVPTHQPSAVERTSVDRSPPARRWDAPPPAPMLDLVSTSQDLEQHTPGPTRTPESSGTPPTSTRPAQDDAAPAPTPSPAIRHRDPSVVAVPSTPIEPIRESRHTEQPLSRRPDQARAEQRPELERIAPVRTVPVPEPPPGWDSVAAPVVAIGEVTVSRRERLDHSDSALHLSQLRPAPRPDSGEGAPWVVETQPPTIQVTIARIEIRAPAAVPRDARRPKENPAVMPLTEYLRRHKGGA